MKKKSNIFSSKKKRELIKKKAKEKTKYFFAKGSFTPVGIVCWVLYLYNLYNIEKIGTQKNYALSTIMGLWLIFSLLLYYGIRLGFYFQEVKNCKNVSVLRDSITHEQAKMIDNFIKSNIGKMSSEELSNKVEHMVEEFLHKNSMNSED